MPRFSGMNIPEKYSRLISIDENTIGILYESNRVQMVFQQIPLDEILSCGK